MNLLTDDEIEKWEALCVDAIDSKGWGFLDRKKFARAIESALLQKLAAGVSVEPTAERRRIRYTWGECWDYRDDEKVPFTVPFNLVVVTPTAPLFTLDQLTTAIAAARVQENERCARTLEAIGCQGYADALRALLGKEQL